MVVLVLTACPAGLRGHLTKWLLEIDAGVFVGHATSRVREELWGRVVELAKDGRAIMVYTAKNEQRLQFKVHRHEWVPTDFDGIQLMMRPHSGASGEAGGSKSSGVPEDAPRTALRKGWSKASRYRRAASRRREG